MTFALLLASEWAGSRALADSVVAPSPAPKPFEYEPPLFAVELRLSYGLALGGGSGKAVERVSPLEVAFVGELTLLAETRLTLLLGLYYEGIDRAAIGALAGFRLRPGDGPYRFTAGMLGTMAPYTILGADAGGGYCASMGKKKATHLCADAEADLFFLGNDLPQHRVAAQVMLVLGANFDVY